MLQRKHPLSIDSDILYDDESHAYGLRRFPGKRFESVTSVAASRMPPFNGAVISAKLAESGRGKYRGKTASEIRGMWAELATLGTALHARVETFYNGGLAPAHDGFNRAAAVLKEVLGLRPWRSELRMASAKTAMAGTADMVFTSAGKGPEDGVTIVDWKRTDTAPADSRYETCLKELSHLPGGKFWKFAVQLNLYAQLLWDTCQVPTVKMLLVLLHPSGIGYDILRVPHMPEVEAIYRRRSMLK